MANTNDKPTCGQCAQLRQSDGYCRKKGYVNSLREAPAKCFISREDQAILKAEHPLAPKDAVRKEKAPAPENKRCPRCGETKPASEFGIRNQSADGLQIYCRDCLRKMQGKRPIISDEERSAATAAVLEAGEKVCRQCGKTLPLDHFSKHFGARDGYSNICRDCRGINVSRAMKKRYAEKRKAELNPEEVQSMELKVKIDKAEPANAPTKPDYRPKKQSTTKTALIMKPVKVYYERCVNLGDYENEKIGIEIELEDGDNVTKAVNAARERIRVLTGASKAESQWERYERIANDLSQPYQKVMEARKWLEENPDQKPEEPPL